MERADELDWIRRLLEHWRQGTPPSLLRCTLRSSAGRERDGASIFGKSLGEQIGTFGARAPAFDRLPETIAYVPGGSMGVLLAVVGRGLRVVIAKLPVGQM